MANTIATSSESDEFINHLRRLGIISSGATLARIALAYSLAKVGKKVPASKNAEGFEIKRSTLWGDDETIFRSLICIIHAKSFEDDDEFFSRRSVVKNHVDHGCTLLKALWEECQEDEILFWQRIADEVKLSSQAKRVGVASALNIDIGFDESKDKLITIELNNTNQHANSHLAIMGKPGVGKTQFLLKLLADIRTQSKFKTNFIFFDYKGDVASNTRFVEVTQAQTFQVPTQHIPINPFVLENYSDDAILLSAEEKAESFASIDKKIGVVQKGALSKAIKLAYEQRSSQAEHYPDFNDIYVILQQIYEEEGKKNDSLTEIIRRLSEFHLFWEHGSQESIIEKVTEESFVIDLHKLPIRKELIAYLVIERLYKEMSALPDSATSDGWREIRTILVIDEAHNYLPHNNIFLQRIIREGRSKGIFVFFASQSPSDYTQKSFDFKELLEFSFIFGCKAVQPKAIQEILGCNSNNARSLQTDIAKLEPFKVISKALSDQEEFTQFTAEAFYQKYQ